MKLTPVIVAIALSALVFLPSCEEMQTSTGLTSSTSGSAIRAGSPATPPQPEALSKHDVALRFLTAYIRLDRNMALNYATPEAVSKLNWNISHAGNIPYYDDKMLLQFRGGWARVFFQDMGNTFKIVDFEVHQRR